MVIAIVIVAILVALLALAWIKPNTIDVQRTVEIKAPPERVFVLINDLQNWPAWSPHDKMDPTMKRSYGAVSGGLGASCQWDSRGNAGRGRAEITDSLVPHKVTVTVDFEKPFKVRNLNEFTLDTAGDTTTVTWALHGAMPYILKVMGLFFSMKRMYARHFDAGLAGLKALAEKQ
jgi:uncharacterized protein YndB with AHSA1/START domain